MIRLSLALVIMAAHLTESGYYLAQMALLGFYGLAGYTATASMQGPYCGRPKDFLISRWLRIWPPYAVIFCISFLALLFTPIALGRMGLPTTSVLGLQLFGWVPEYPAIAVVPQAWMIRLMVSGYLVIALGISATPRRCGAWLLISMAWANWQSFTLGSDSYYYSMAIASLCLSVGSAAHHMGLTLQRDRGAGAVAASLSYPIYLSHYVMGAAMAGVWGLAPGWPLFWASMLPTLCLSWLLVLWVEQPISDFRKSLRSLPNVQ